MKKSKELPQTIDAYIADFPLPVQQQLQSIREAVKKIAPEAAEKIGYGIPTFTLEGNLVHFAAFKQHISFFPGSSGIEAFKTDLAGYTTSKGTVQFPINQPIPVSLIKKITAYRVKQNREIAAIKKGNKLSLKKTPKSGNPALPGGLAAPARRALEARGVRDLRQLSRLSEPELRSLHGIGPGSISILQQALRQAGLTLRQSAIE
jgi:uncharacterized protein YdhG (YjbR/CyaY superfamily)